MVVVVVGGLRGQIYFQSATWSFVFLLHEKKVCVGCGGDLTSKNEQHCFSSHLEKGADGRCSQRRSFTSNSAAVLRQDVRTAAAGGVGGVIGG